MAPLPEHAAAPSAGGGSMGGEEVLTPVVGAVPMGRSALEGSAAAGAGDVILDHNAMEVGAVYRGGKSKGKDGKAKDKGAEGSVKRGGKSV